MLTSVHNPHVRAVRALLDKRREREAQQRFVIEGVRLVETALQAGARLDVAYYTSDLADDARGARLLDKLRAGCETVEVSEAVLRAMSDTETPQGVVAVAPFLTMDDGRWTTDDGLKTQDQGLRTKDQARPSALLLVVDAVRDPGNLGTLLRSAAAVGVDEVLLAPGTVDVYNPKVVRAGMGAHFTVPALALTWEEVQARLAGVVARVAVMDARQPYDAVDWTVPSALVVGSEAEGVSAVARTVARDSVSIPMRPGVESLNAAMAATVILFEAARQRRQTVEG